MTQSISLSTRHDSPRPTWSTCSGDGKRQTFARWNFGQRSLLISHNSEMWNVIFFATDVSPYTRKFIF